MQRNSYVVSYKRVTVKIPVALRSTYNSTWHMTNAQYLLGDQINEWMKK